MGDRRRLDAFVLRTNVLVITELMTCRTTDVQNRRIDGSIRRVDTNRAAPHPVDTRGMALCVAVALADFNKAVGMADSRVSLTDDRHHVMTFSSSGNVHVAEEANMKASISARILHQVWCVCIAGCYE